MMTLTSELVNSKIIDLLLHLAGMAQIILSNQAFASLNILYMLLHDFDLDINLNTSVLNHIIHRHIEKSYDFSHVCL